MKLLQKYGDETQLSDFSPEELRELLAEQENGDEPTLPTKEEFKEKYFRFYDDVKDKSLKKQDW